MSAVARPAALDGPSNGGVAARRAVTRWTRRMFRREWRQQLLVVTLLTVAVAAAIGSVTLVYNTSSAVNSEFGSANTVLEFDGTDPQKLAAGLAAAKKWFGTTDVIGHRSIAVPGSVDRVDFRAHDPDGAYGSDLVALRQGRNPEGRHEVAVTDGVAKLLGLELGSTVALDGIRRTVVGVVENPRKLSDEFALVSPAFAGAPNSVMVLVDANDASLDSFQDSLGEGRSGFAGLMRVGNDGPPDTLAMFSVATVFLLLASLIAAAGFAVIAQRRLRHLGVLAAIGATQQHLRFVLIANGAIVGAIAALFGTLVGLALWVVFAPTLESAVDHRVDRLSLPTLLIALTVLLALFGAIGAAWWPGRTVARLPVTLALSGRPPKPRPARHSAIAAAALIAVGIGCLALSNRDRPPLIVGGIVATIAGCLLLGPVAIRIFSGLAGRVSIAPRLALRDLVRYQARSGAALAAVTLALGIAATVVIIASAEAAKEGAEPANLSDRQLRVYLGPPEVRELTPVDTPARLDRLAARVRRIAAQLDGATVIPLRKATQPGVAPFVLFGTRVFAPLDLMSPSNSPEERKSSRAALYVATPAVLRYLGFDPATIAAGTDFLVDRSAGTDDLILPDMRRRTKIPVGNVQKIDFGHHLFGSDSAHTPPTFITLNALHRHGWNQIPAGWLVDSSRPLTSDQIADARTIAADDGLTVEARHGKPSYAKTMAIATSAGALLALAILAMTVTGATSGIRRRLTATTAGALAFLGTLLGVAGAYVVLAATYHDDLGYLSDVPVLYLVLAIIGVPLAAAAAGWLLAGREPRAIARTAIQ
jgi:putative ABC transport system permease protein